MIYSVRRRLVCVFCGRSKTCAVDGYPSGGKCDYTSEGAAFDAGWRVVGVAPGVRVGRLAFRCGNCRGSIEPYSGPERWWERAPEPRAEEKIDANECARLRVEVQDLRKLVEALLVLQGRKQ